jgi:hypothetical protein
MKLAFQPVRCKLRARLTPPNLSTCARCASIDSAIALLLGTAGPYRDLRPASSATAPAMQNATPASTFRMNTCESVSKQRTLTTFRMNTYEKQGEGGPLAHAITRNPGSLRRDPKKPPRFSRALCVPMANPFLSSVWRLFALFLHPSFFVFSNLQPLFAKHPGGGATARLEPHFVILAMNTE